MLNVFAAEGNEQMSQRTRNQNELAIMPKPAGEPIKYDAKFFAMLQKQSCHVTKSEL
jgi:hypothetical protein